MACNSRAKGAAGERELAERLREQGYTAKRTQQYCGANGDGDLTVDEMPGLHVECKRVQRLNIHEAMLQSASDAAKVDAMPCVMHRRNGAEWLCTIRLADMEQFAGIVMAGISKKG